MATEWNIQFDWNRDGDYADAYDDQTARVISAQWTLGMIEPYQLTAGDMMLHLILSNSDGHLSPENTTSPLYGRVKPHVPVRIVTDDGITERVMWTGWIDQLKPGVGRYAERRMEILASGPLPFYIATETRLGLQENQRTDQIISQLIEEVVYPPALAGAFILGVVGQSSLGESTRLVDPSGGRVLDEGALTLAYAVDNWVREGGYTDAPQTGYDVMRGIREITAAERGKFFFNREGQAVFWNRQHPHRQEGRPVTLNDTMQDLAYSYAGADHLKNEVIVIAHPRTISETNTEILWELADGVIRVPANDTRELYVKYEGDDSVRIGAKEVSVTDVTFEQGTASFTVDAKANGAELLFTNNAATDALVKTCIVRGRKIVDRGVIEVKAQDGESLSFYGRRTMRLNLPSVDNLDDAQYIADFEVEWRGQPRGLATSVTLKSHIGGIGSHHSNQLAKTIGDRVTITETQTGHSATYLIVGESHQIEGKLYATTWYLEPELDYAPLLIGVTGRGEIGNPIGF